MQELEEQERKLKGKKVATTEIEISKVNINSRMELEWRKKSESGLLESVQSQLETVHNANAAGIGKTEMVEYRLNVVMCFALQCLTGPAASLY